MTHKLSQSCKQQESLNLSQSCPFLTTCISYILDKNKKQLAIYMLFYYLYGVCDVIIITLLYDNL